MRVIADLVVNHTSDRHPWFKAARASRDSTYRDFYVWSDDAAEERPGRADLPRPGDERLDLRRAGRPVLPAPLLQAPAGPQRRQPAGPRRDRQDHGLLAAARAVRVPGRRRAVLPGDHGRAGRRGRAAGPARVPARPAGLPRPARRRRHPARRGQPARTSSSCSSSAAPTATSCTMQFDFIGDAAALPVAGPGRRRPLVDALHSRPQPQPESQWASFVRNHDELTLDKLTDAERQEVFAAFGPEPEMQVYGRGLRPAAAADARRRSAPDPDGLQPAVLAARHAGAVLRRGDRDGREPRPPGAGRRCVRRCSGRPTSNGGFSNARAVPAARPGRRGRRTGRSSSTSPTSSATRTRCSTSSAARPALPRLPRARLGRRSRSWSSRTRAVLAHRCTWDDGSHGAAAQPRRPSGEVPLTLVDLDRAPGWWTCSATDGRARRQGPGRADTEGYGYRWLRVTPPGSRRLRYPSPALRPRTARQIAEFVTDSCSLSAVSSRTVELTTCRISLHSCKSSRSASAPRTSWSRTMEDDDPILRSVDGKIVDTWREGYPYDERMGEREYEVEKRLLQIELLKLQGWVKDTGRAGDRVRGPGRRRQGRHDQAVHGAPEPARRAGGRAGEADRARAARSGTSSATSSTCRPPGRSSCSTGPGTTAPASSG